MAGGEAIGAEIAGEAEQIGELHPLVAGDAGDRRAPARIFVGEALDHGVAEAALIVEDIMGDAEPVGDRPRVVNVLAGAAGPACARPPRHDRRAAASRRSPRRRCARRARPRPSCRRRPTWRRRSARPSSGPAELEIRVHRSRPDSALERRNAHPALLLYRLFTLFALSATGDGRVLPAPRRQAAERTPRAGAARARRAQRRAGGAAGGEPDGQRAGRAPCGNAAPSPRPSR